MIALRHWMATATSCRRSCRSSRSCRIVHAAASGGAGSRVVSGGAPAVCGELMSRDHEIVVCNRGEVASANSNGSRPNKSTRSGPGTNGAGCFARLSERAECGLQVFDFTARSVSGAQKRGSWFRFKASERGAPVVDCGRPRRPGRGHRMAVIAWRSSCGRLSPEQKHPVWTVWTVVASDGV
jgi:hypothetical protein